MRTWCGGGGLRGVVVRGAGYLFALCALRQSRANGHVPRRENDRDTTIAVAIWKRLKFWPAVHLIGCSEVESPRRVRPLPKWVAKSSHVHDVQPVMPLQ